MKYNHFGTTDLKVSEIGLGCSYIGGTLERKAECDPVRILHEALDSGINFFDTADIYSQGRSEEIIGKAFKGKRDDVIIATKTGYYLSSLGGIASRFKPVYRYLNNNIPWLKKSAQEFRSTQKKQDFSPKYISSAVENSLKRLKTDYIDILQLHNPDSGQIENGELFHALDRLKQDGKIRYYGVSCRDVDDALICLKNTKISSVQVPINLLEQKAVKELLPYNNRSVAVIARQPLAGGTLVKTDNLEANGNHHSEKFSFLMNNGSRTLTQAAMRFVLQLHGVSVVIVGTTNEEHLREILNTTHLPFLSEDEMVRIQRLDMTD